MPQPLNANQIADQLTTRRVGAQVRTLDEVTSTNDIAMAAATPDNDGLAIFAERQTAGRGRLGRQWLSPRGAGVLCSVVLSDPARTPASGSLVLVSAVAACEAISAVCEDVSPVIRWPNDLYVNGAKLAGILVESRGSGQARVYVVGIGINCYQTAAHFPTELQAKATSLEIASRHPIRRADLAVALLTQLDHWLGGAWLSDDEIRLRWQHWAEAMGQRVRLQEAGRSYIGRTLEIDPVGGLAVQLELGGRRVFDPATTSMLPAGDG